ncbi:MAG: rRNA pseudouridine synthase [Lentisphaeria bacterium]|nr:rRNA pseudouridine synthase [Lentisphaeria bacterium]
MNEKNNNQNNENSVRLVKYISSTGVASRRKAGDLVAAGRIKVNGVVCSDMSRQITPQDTVMLDNSVITPEERKLCIMLNKPVGYVCTNEDIHAELKAVDLIDLSKQYRLFSAGRLDKDSEGLILFSNDGDLVKKITHPSFEILKKYEVTTAKKLHQADIDKIISGTIIDEHERLKAEKVEVLSEKNRLYCFTLNEGKKREIRRLVKYFQGNRVIKLKRISIGSLTLGNLAEGKYRELTADEIALVLKNQKINDL